MKKSETDQNEPQAEPAKPAPTESGRRYATDAEFQETMARVLKKWSGLMKRLASR